MPELARCSSRVLRLRALIALVVADARVFAAVAGVPDDRQPDDPRQARRDQRDPRDRDDVRHPQRRHRPVGRLDRRALRHGRRALLEPRPRRSSRSASWSISTPGSWSSIALARRHGARRGQRLAGRAAAASRRSSRRSACSTSRAARRCSCPAARRFRISRVRPRWATPGFRALGAAASPACPSRSG